MTQLGKYGTDRDNILHYMATSDWAMGSFGDVEAPTGYVWKMSNNPADVQVSNTELTSLIEDQIELYSIEDGPEFRASLVGHFLIAEDSNGFVSVAEYASAELLQQAYDSLEAIFSEWDNQEDEA
jgi:hypothetical protein